MKKYIFLVGLVISVMISQIPPATISYARSDSQKVEIKVESVAVIQDDLTNEEIVTDLVNQCHANYGVSTTSMMRTLRNENNTFDFDRQSGLYYKAGNRWGFSSTTREKSYGVAQIHLPDHPSITIEQATDPVFSIGFMCQMFAQGKAKMWMGYSKKY